MEEFLHAGKSYLFYARDSNSEADEGESNHTDELHGDQRLTSDEGQDRELKIDQWFVKFLGILGCGWDWIGLMGDFTGVFIPSLDPRHCSRYSYDSNSGCSS